MIFGNIKDVKRYEFLPANLKKCFEYLKNHDLATLEKGSYEIEGKDLFVNIENYYTVNRDERFWEAHRKYIDIHVIFEGKETIDINFLDNLEPISYEEDKDFAMLKGEKNATVNLVNQGDFLICYPEDVHRTAIMYDQSEKIKKAIFKVKI